MKDIKNYIEFCRKFQSYRIPKLRFKELNERYQYLYRTKYNISDVDIDKASFIIFLSCNFISISLSLLFTSFNLLIIILYSIILSLIISYKFNSVLYKHIYKNESQLNSLLYVIRIDFSLIQKTTDSNSDKCLNFIELIKEYNIPGLAYSKTIFKRIHEGKSPEKELTEFKTPSMDFNNYIKSLIINKFESYDFDNFTESSLENQFKIYLRQIQSKISILFFIGLFFPIGLCFLILFQLINVVFLIFFLPLFLISLNLIFKRFMRNQSYLIGLINDYSGPERKKFKEFILLLQIFASNLKSNISPEVAFLKSYNQNKNLFNILKKSLKNQISCLLNFSYSISEILEILKSELKSWRYTLILDAINKYVEKSAYYSSSKIFEILATIYKHQKLEKKLEIMMKGEKFKIFFFIFLLPVITGAISGFFPFFTIVIKNLELVGNVVNIFFKNPINLFSIGIIILVLVSTISITSNYFLRIIYYEKKLLIIFCSNIIFILTFLISFINIGNFI
ncbi:MAG: hypothetical protein ACFE94_00080 [Candidatus Hodarchaeota archaeon]